MSATHRAFMALAFLPKSTPRCDTHWLRSANQTQAAALLQATGGSEERAAQAGVAIGWERLQSLGESGKTGLLGKVIDTPRKLELLGRSTSSGSDKRDALAEVRDTAIAYTGSREPTGAVAPPATPVAATTASIGTPSRFPTNVAPPKANPIEMFTFVREVVNKTAGGMADRAVQRYVFKPWQDYVANPTARGALAMYERFAQTPVGQVFEAQRVKGTSQLQSVLAEDSVVGRGLKYFDDTIVKNEKLWAGIDRAGAVGRQVTKAGAATTLAVLANAYRTGTLQTGTFNTSDKLTPAQQQMVKGVNIPPGMNVRYFTAPTTTTVTVKGQVFNVPSAATVVVAEGTNVVFLPALGPGKPGAQPWVGGVEKGGIGRDTRQIVAASSSVAAAKWVLAGFNIGTENFNVGGRVDGQLVRGLGNIFSAQLDRKDASPGASRARVQTIGIFDFASTFGSSWINAGPIGFVPWRDRNPQSEKITLSTGGLSTPTVGADSGRSQIAPALPIVGASTSKPGAQDIKFLNAWASQFIPGSPAKP